MTEKMISPLSIYKNPERFFGVIIAGKKNGQLDYPIVVFDLMKRLFPDFPEKLAKSMKAYIMGTKDERPVIFFVKETREYIQIPDEIYEEIKKFL